MYTHLHLKFFLRFRRGTRSKYRSPLKRDTLHSLLCPNLDDLKLLQKCLDHKSLKLEPKENKLIGTVNVFDVDMKDH
jgi:hypothetical protein